MSLFLKQFFSVGLPFPVVRDIFTRIGSCGARDVLVNGGIILHNLE